MVEGGNDEEKEMNEEEIQKLLSDLLLKLPEANNPRENFGCDAHQDLRPEKIISELTKKNNRLRLQLENCSNKSSPTRQLPSASNVGNPRLPDQMQQSSFGKKDLTQQYPPPNGASFRFHSSRRQSPFVKNSHLRHSMAKEFALTRKFPSSNVGNSAPSAQKRSLLMKLICAEENPQPAAPNYGQNLSQDNLNLFPQSRIATPTSSYYSRNPGSPVHQESEYPIFSTVQELVWAPNDENPVFPAQKEPIQAPNVFRREPTNINEEDDRPLPPFSSLFLVSKNRFKKQ